MLPNEGRDVAREVAEVLLRYATGIDRKDWPLFRSCFTQDFHADYGPIGVWDGVDAITDYMTRTHPSGVRSLHRITNVAITPEADGVVARSYVDVIYVVVETGAGMNAAGIYDDEVVHTAAGWKLARRRYTMVHMSRIGRS